MTKGNVFGSTVEGSKRVGDFCVSQNALVTKRLKVSVVSDDSTFSLSVEAGVALGKGASKLSIFLKSFKALIILKSLKKKK